MEATRYFAQSYSEARGKFLAAADTAGLDVESHVHPMRGRDGEVLAMDVVRVGPRDAQALLVISSACHGAEGFCGSGVQGALLAHESFHAASTAAGVAVLYIHALNPYGFSWWRRVTHENVDLNRNFHDFHQPLPQNRAYDEIAHLLVPNQWPPTSEVQAMLEAWVASHGERALQSAMSSGQYEHPQGLFFGGRDPTWSNLTLRGVLREHGRHATRLGWIDLHTGLGPSGHGERILATRDDDAAYARARRWWGQVTSMYDGSSSSALLTGLMFNAAYDECPHAEYTGIALEYGTVPMAETTEALRAEQWLENHPEAPAAQREEIKRRMRDAFYVDTDEWKHRIVTQGIEAALQGVWGLSGRA